MAGFARGRKRGRNAFQTSAKLHFSEKKLLGVRGTLTKASDSWARHGGRIGTYGILPFFSMATSTSVAFVNAYFLEWGKCNND